MLHGEYEIPCFMWYSIPWYLWYSMTYAIFLLLLLYQHVIDLWFLLLAVIDHPGHWPVPLPSPPPPPPTPSPCQWQDGKLHIRTHTYVIIQSGYWQEINLSITCSLWSPDYGVRLYSWVIYYQSKAGYIGTAIYVRVYRHSNICI